MKKILFYLCYFEIIAHNMLRSVSFIDEGASNVIYLVAMGILAVIAFLNLDKTNIKKAASIIAMTFGLMLSTYLTHDVFLLTIWLIVLAFKELDFEGAIKYDILIKTLLFVFVVLMYKLGLTDSGVMYDGNIARYSMGFGNPNIFSSYVMSIVIEILYLGYSKHKYMSFILVLSAILLIHFVAGSRTQIILLMCAYLLFILSNNKLKIPKKRILKIICENMFMIMTLISVVLVGAFANNLSGMQELDNSLSGRLRISSRIIDDYGIDFYKTNSDVKEYNETTIDNQYVYIMVIDGVSILFGVYLFTNKYLKYLSRKNKVMIFYLILLFIVAGLVEKVGLRAQYNVFILYSAGMVYSGLPKTSKVLIKGEEYGKETTKKIA